MLARWIHLPGNDWKQLSDCREEKTQWTCAWRSKWTRGPLRIAAEFFLFISKCPLNAPPPGCISGPV